MVQTYHLRSPRITGFCVARASALLRLLFLGRRRSTRACCVRAVPRWLRSVHTLGKGTAPTRGLSHFGARPWCDVPAAASQNQQSFAWHTRARHCARCLSVGGAVRKLAARARRVALVVIGPCTKYGQCTDKRPLSFNARPWCDVPAAASQNKPAFAGKRERATALAVSREEAQHANSLRARRAALVVVG